MDMICICFGAWIAKKCQFRRKPVRQVPVKVLYLHIYIHTKFVLLNLNCL